MKRIRYSVSWTTGGVVFAIAVLLSSLVLFAGPNTETADVWRWVIATGFLVVAVAFKFGIYVSIQGDYIYRVQEFMTRRKIKISEIQGIYYEPTFIVGKVNRSIYIVADPHDRSKVIELSNTAFDKKTLTKIVKDLVDLNPSIKLDEHTSTLLKT